MMMMRKGLNGCWTSRSFGFEETCCSSSCVGVDLRRSMLGRLVSTMPSSAASAATATAAAAAVGLNRYNGISGATKNDVKVLGKGKRCDFGQTKTRKPVGYGLDTLNRQIKAEVVSSEREMVADQELYTKAYSKLQNGSDVRGVALDLNPEEPVTLTPAKVFFIGAAFADWLAEQLQLPCTSLRVSVGRDSRLSSPLLSAAFIAGLASCGVAATSFGLCTTPAMFMSCILPGYAYDGAVMITASHLPVNRNGAKFFVARGGLGKPDIKWILSRAKEKAENAKVDPNNIYEDSAYVLSAALTSDSSLISRFDFLDVYASHLRQLVVDGVNHPVHRERPLQGFKIVVNPGNGAGGFFATDVLGPLGADVSASINIFPDGNFPAHSPNPENLSAVEATTKAVLESGADLGIMLDTDVDRSGFIDSEGKVINRNRYIALMSAIALRDYPGETIVTDSCTSNGLHDFIESLNGKHFRYKKGYKNIIDKGIELNKNGVPCPLMMETSGHGAMRENYFLDDGAYGALKIVIEAARRKIEGIGSVSSLLEDLKEPVEAMEIRVKILAEDVAAEGQKITADFKDWLDAGAGGYSDWLLEAENYEGWRVRIKEESGKEGWLLLRPSLHDPDIVINVESESDGGMKVSIAHLLNFFALHPEYHVSTKLLEDYISS